MFKNYYRYLHRLFYRLYIKIYKAQNKSYYEQRSSLEPYVKTLCKKLLNKKTVSLLTYYIEEKYYILHNDVLVIIKTYECEIIDGTNHYSVVISPKTHSIIMNVFNGKLKQKRDKLEESYLKNVTNSLKLLCNEV
jgi:hypothetical protein